MYKPKHFSIEELVPPETLSKYGESLCWTFMDHRLLEVLDWLRMALNRSIWINRDDISNNRGFRTNLYNTSRMYCSQHLFGRAADFNVDGMTVEEVHQFLRDNIDDIPHPIWVEEADGVNRVHIDVRYSDKGKLYFFKA